MASNRNVVVHLVPPSRGYAILMKGTISPTTRYSACMQLVHGKECKVPWRDWDIACLVFTRHVAEECYLGNLALFPVRFADEVMATPRVVLFLQY